MREADDPMKRANLVLDPIEGSDVGEIVTAACAALDRKSLKHGVQDGGGNGRLRQLTSVRDQVACREPQCHDDVDPWVGFQSIQCRVQRGYAPIAVQSGLRRDGQPKTVSVNLG